MEYHIKHYELEQGALEIQYIEEYFGEFPRKKTAAEIVERLTGRDPAAAEAEVRQLVAMVQQTLEATKTFIFDVRPMVLDDLGLVPTLRRAARDRGRHAGVPVEFESLGTDRRLPVELESGLFRIIDDALAGYLAARPERVAVRLDWGDDLEAELSAGRSAIEVPAPDLPADDGSLPPALAAMVEDRRAGHAAVVERAGVTRVEVAALAQVRLLGQQQLVVVGAVGVGACAAGASP